MRSTAGNTGKRAIFIAAAALALGGLGRGAPGRALDASGPGGFDLAAAVAAAPAGGEVVVPAGVHGPVTIDRPMTLVGRDGAIIDAAGRGDGVRITAPDVTLRNLVIRGTGTSVDRENAGVAATAPRLTIEGCRLEDVLFGIVLSTAPGSVIRGNHIAGKDLDIARRGDAIRVWQSAGTLVESNTVVRSRDVVVWYSADTRLAGNTVTDGRYGLHTMYTDSCVLEGNRLEGNSVGIFMMYSRDLEARGNVIAGNRGPSGFGIGLKDVDGVVLEDNLIAGNRVGINLDTSPTRGDVHHHHRRNIVAFNDVGVAFMPAVRNNHFESNVFVENIENVAILGGGAFEGQNSFTVEGRGNYWSDYRGFDLDGDGIGDVEYRATGLFESLMDREPKLRYFLYSPAQQAIDMAARSFPVVTPRPKVVDTAPLTRAPVGVARSGGARRPAGFGLIAAVLAGAGALLALAAGSSLRLAPATAGGTP
jgi:nitrous oxidase accessory protein